MGGSKGGGHTSRIQPKMHASRRNATHYSDGRAVRTAPCSKHIDIYGGSLCQRPPLGGLLSPVPWAPVTACIQGPCARCGTGGLLALAPLRLGSHKPQAAPHHTSHVSQWRLGSLLLLLPCIRLRQPTLSYSLVLGWLRKPFGLGLNFVWV